MPQFEEFVPRWRKFPAPCPFCGHQRLAEGICQCPADCPSCEQGCCGKVLTYPAPPPGF